MARINRYDTPAQDNYFNTFVPIPMEQLTALGMARQEDLLRKQESLGKYLDEASLVDYIAGSKDESFVKGSYIPKLQKAAEEMLTADITDPVQYAKIMSSIKSPGLQERIRRIEESKAGWTKAQNIKSQLQMAGKWNPLLDKDPALQRSWDSEQAIYSYSPEAYTDKAELFEQYYKHLKPQTQGVVYDKNTGLPMLRSGISASQVNSVAEQMAQSLATTPQGMQQVELFRIQYPELASNMSDVEILKNQMNDYGRQYIMSDDQPINPDWLTSLSGGNDNITQVPYLPSPVQGQNYTLEELDNGVHLFDKTGVKSKNVDVAKKDIEKNFEQMEKGFNQPISKWKFKDFYASNRMPGKMGIKMAQAIIKELPEEARNKVGKDFRDSMDSLTERLSKSSVDTPWYLMPLKASLYSLSTTTKGLSDINRAVVDPSYVKKHDNLLKVSSEIKQKYPELSYVEDSNGNKIELSPKQKLDNYIDAINAGTSSDVTIYNVQDQKGWEDLNSYVARGLQLRSGEIGGSGFVKGMRKMDDVARDLGYKDASEISDIMLDYKDSRVKVLGYGTDTNRPGTWAISVQDNNSKNKKEGRILYVNADDPVERNFASANTLLYNAKLNNDISVPWTVGVDANGNVEERIIKLTHPLQYNPSTQKYEFSPILTEYIKYPNGEEEMSTDENGNPITYSMGEINAAALQSMSGLNNSPIVTDRDKVRQTGYRYNPYGKQ